MAFVRELGVKVTVPARRHRAGGRHDRPGVSRTSASSKSIWDDERCWTSTSIDLHYGAAQALRGVSLDAPSRQGHLRARPQRRRQDELAARASSGQQPVTPRRDRVRGRRHHRLCSLPSARAAASPTCRRAARSSRCSRSRRISRPASRRSARGPQHPRRRLRSVSRAEEHAAPARRRSVRRPAAAARDRPRAGDAAAAAAARRADRGHPAVDHQGHRPRHRLSAQLGQMAIVLVEQYLDFARELGDRFVVMDRGSDRLSCEREDRLDEAALEARDGDLTSRAQLDPKPQAEPFAAQPRASAASRCRSDAGKARRCARVHEGGSVARALSESSRARTSKP